MLMQVKVGVAHWLALIGRLASGQAGGRVGGWAVFFINVHLLTWPPTSAPQSHTHHTCIASTTTGASLPGC